jgi:hypothetical protein
MRSPADASSKYCPTFARSSSAVMVFILLSYQHQSAMI